MTQRKLAHASTVPAPPAAENRIAVAVGRARPAQQALTARRSWIRSTVPSSTVRV
jgi:hypothetical protein